VRSRATDAFTLAELLVVAAVVALLMGLSLAAVASARATGHATACLSNLRQFGYAVSVYMDQHNECIPRRGQGTQRLTRIDRLCDWFNCLLPDVGSPAYFDLVAQGKRPNEGEKHPLICPSASDPGWRYFLPYAMNMYLSPWIRPEPHRLYELPHPATVAFMADSPGPYCATIPSPSGYGVLPRHSGQANVLFLDGHARAYDGAYLGCGVVDPRRPDVRWETESAGINWRPGDGS